MSDTLKPHWVRLMDMANTLKNCELKVTIQDGLPVKLEVHELVQKEFDLTKE